jgi:hypothetical protein
VLTLRDRFNDYETGESDVGHDSTILQRVTCCVPVSTVGPSVVGVSAAFGQRFGDSQGAAGSRSGSGATRPESVRLARLRSAVIQYAMCRMTVRSPVTLLPAWVAIRKGWGLLHSGSRRLGRLGV